MAYNQSYKKWHKPNMSETARTKQGYYKPKNTDKYIGDPNLIVYRSSWEYSFCKWCDFSPSIRRWSSEPVKIPYYDRISKLDECKKLGLDPNNPKNWVVKNYNTDFWVEIDKGGGNIEKWFIEVKPKHKLKKPMPPKQNASLKEIKAFNRSAKEYIINEAKFAAINEWAKNKGCKFFIFTEDQLIKFGIIGGRFELPQKNK